ncbi:MAG TPA: DUF1349 domain-containing protein [Candidatus Avisuccinivibrio pullicola]|nr:DUF1349 domain-containing protein [Candidatus Avisuccinivibrio pullicola]
MSSAPLALTACDLRAGTLHFTQQLLNAASSCAIRHDGALSLDTEAVSDLFCDPDGKLSNTSLPLLLTAVDNRRPFTLTAKVTPGFTPEGTYNAANPMLYASPVLWQKLCFEQDERGRHRIVSMRTDSTSDDCNHERLDVTSVYLKIASDGHTVGSYYSADGKTYEMVRVYKNVYPDHLYAGIASQCPVKGHCLSLFEELTLSQEQIGDFRMGS